MIIDTADGNRVAPETQEKERKGPERIENDGKKTETGRKRTENYLNGIHKDRNGSKKTETGPTRIEKKR